VLERESAHRAFDDDPGSRYERRQRRKADKSDKKSRRKKSRRA